MSWVTWSISNWQFLLWCLLFQSWMMGSRTFFSVSQQLRPKLSAKWMLSNLSPKKLRKMTTFEENKLLQLIQSYNCSSLITLPYQSPINKRIYTSIWFLHINQARMQPQSLSGSRAVHRRFFSVNSPQKVSDQFETKIVLRLPRKRAASFRNAY